MAEIRSLPSWAHHRTYLTAAQVALILGFVGSEGQFDEVAARKYTRRHGLGDLKRLMARAPKFPRPHYPHGDEGRPYWLTKEVVAWTSRQGRASGQASGGTATRGSEEVDSLPPGASPGAREVCA